MRFALSFTALLLASCSPADLETENHVEAVDAPAALPGSILEERATEALRLTLPDTDFRVVSVGPGQLQSICGEVVAPEAGFAAARRFVVLPHGEAEIAPTADIRFEDFSDRFAGFYVELCASPEEVEAINERIRQAAQQEIVRQMKAEVYSSIEEVPAPEAPALPAPPHPQLEVQTIPPTASVRAQEQSEPKTFSDAVLRPSRD